MIRFYENYPLKDYNSFGIQAKAKQFVEFSTADDLIVYLNSTNYRKNEKILFLGGGSNILFLEDFDGLVFHPKISEIDIAGDDDSFIEVEAGAGVIWDYFVEYCVENGWGGIENLSLIPGNVGAAPVQNIGAYGQEVASSVVSVLGFDFKADSLRRIPAEECKFGYRDSLFKNELKNRFLIISVLFKLEKFPEFDLSYGNLKEKVAELGLPSLATIRQAVINVRSSKLPDPVKLGNAGSFFKNPVVNTEFYYSLKKEFAEMPGYPDLKGFTKLAAGWLIQKCGWKGYREGDAGVHEKQALVLVNYGNATGRQIFDLSEKIRQSVFNKFRILLEREINCI